MKIVDVVTERFRYKTRRARDSEGHSHPGAGNLHVLCAMGIRGEYYERGLLHPFLDYEQPNPWLNQIVDPMDDEGYVHVSDRPGLGLDINFDYIREHAIT